MENSFKEEVLLLWATTSGSLVEKLQLLSNGLRIWDRRTRNQRINQRGILTKQLEDLSSKDRDDEALLDLMEAKFQLNLEIDKDEAYWEQRARANWLRSGDHNTSFFHRSAALQKKSNMIRKLQRVDGIEVSSGKDLDEVASSYFQNLFTSTGVGDTSYLLSGIEQRVDTSINSALTARYTEEELVATLKSIGPTKAPGKDGFPTLFFQRY